MNKKDPKSSKPPEAEFDLYGPTGQMAHFDADADRPTSAGAVPAPPRPKAKADPSLKQLAWKGFEDSPEEPEEEQSLTFNRKLDLSDDGMDMTPMVDVTFLLLIFFMVTASFSIQRSIEQPPSQVNEPSNQVKEQESESDYVEIIIDQNDNYWVTTREEGEVETPSETMMRSKVRNAVKDYGAERLLITAHVDSTHEKVIKAWDAGLAAELQRIQLRTTENEY